MKVTTQKELDAAIAAARNHLLSVPDLSGDGTFNVSKAGVVRVSGSSSPRVVASGSSSPRVVASGSSSPRVEAYGSSSPRVVASDSSSPRVEAYGSSSPLVEASDSAAVVTAGRVTVTRGSGAQHVEITAKAAAWRTPAEWCEFYGVAVVDGIATLYKAVESDWRGERKTSVTYRPGEQPQAPDWDGGEAECGGGLHFSPRPAMALRFCVGAEHFLACQVRLSEMAVHPGGSHPTKCKAVGVCAPLVEVDIDGESI